MSKTQKEKMLAGEPYVALDAELSAMTLHAQALLHQFNYSAPAATLEREIILSTLLGAIGRDSIIKPPFY